MNRDFKNALENFAFDAASGRAIRHLYDVGMTAEEMEKELDFPVPLERIKKEIKKPRGCARGKQSLFGGSNQIRIQSL